MNLEKIIEVSHKIADPLKFEYEECVAHYGEADERTIEAKNI